MLAAAKPSAEQVAFLIDELVLLPAGSIIAMQLQQCNTSGHATYWVIRLSLQLGQ